MESLEFITDHRTVLGKLVLGCFLILPWEKAGDHQEWCDDLVVLGDELDVDVWREPVPAKSLTVIFNEKKMPSFELINEAIARIELDRFMNRELGKLIVPGHRLNA